MFWTRVVQIVFIGIVLWMFVQITLLFIDDWKRNSRSSDNRSS